MAKKRKFCAYRATERPYTRFSRFKKMSYVKSKPNHRIVRFNMGDPSKHFAYKVSLVSKTELHIRDLAIESARLTSNRLLEPVLGKKGYRMNILIYPHHILRENPLAAGAGADRMSTGMKCSFGRTAGVAARVMKDQIIMTVEVPKNRLDIAKKAMKRASQKLPSSYFIRVEEQVEVGTESVKKEVPKKVAEKKPEVAKESVKKVVASKEIKKEVPKAVEA